MYFELPNNFAELSFGMVVAIMYKIMGMKKKCLRFVNSRVIANNCKKIGYFIISNVLFESKLS